MAVNQHQVVTFNDGEPLDPVKLNKLASNIDTLYQMTSVSNQTDNSGNSATPIFFTLFHKFEDVGVGQVATHPFNFQNSAFRNEEITGGKVFAAVSVRSGLGKDDNITVSISGITSGQPTIYAVNKGKNVKTIAVDVIAMVLRPVV
jgi:hypothetical protein